jgi:hypothetical protein
MRVTAARGATTAWLALVASALVAGCFDARDLPADLGPDDAGAADLGPDGAVDGTVDGAGPSCEPVLVEPFDDPALPGWEPGSLVLHHADPEARLPPLVEQGWYLQGEAPPSVEGGAGGGHHRPLPAPLRVPVQLVARVSANHEAPTSQTAVGLFEGPSLSPCCDGGAAAGRGWVCAWFPHERMVQIRWMPEDEIVAVAPVPPDQADSGWHELACVHDEDGRWAIGLDGQQLPTEVNTAVPANTPLEIVSTYLSARSPGQRLDDVAVIPCP